LALNSAYKRGLFQSLERNREYVVLLRATFIVILSGFPMLAASQTPGSTRAETLALQQEGKQLALAGRRPEAEKVLLKALALCPNAQPFVDACISGVSSHLGDLKVKAAAFTEAETYLTQALAAAERGFPPQDPWIVERLRQLGDLYQRQSKLAESEKAFRRAAAIAQVHLRDNPNLLASCLDNLVRVLLQMRSFDQAIEVGNLAFDVLKSDRRVSPETRNLILLNTAHSMFEIQRYGEAEKLYTQLARSVRPELSNLHLNMVAHALFHAARVMIATDRQDEAKGTLAEAITIGAKLGGGRNADLALSCSTLAEIYQSQGDAAQAEAFFRCAVAVRAALKSPEDTKFGLLLYSLGVAVAQQHRYAEAQEFLRRSVATAESALLSDHSNLDNARTALAEAMREAERPGTARAAAEIAGSSRLGSGVQGQGVWIAKIEAEVAFALARIGQSDHADAVLSQAIRSASLDKIYSPAAVGALQGTIADELWRRGDIKESRSHLEQAVETLTAAPDAEARNFLENLIDVAQLLEKDNQFERAAGLVKRALVIADASKMPASRWARDAVAFADRQHSRGLYASAIGLWQEVARLAQAAGNLELLSVAESGLAVGFYEVGRNRQSEQFARRVYDREAQSPSVDMAKLGVYGFNLTFALLASGQAAAAEAPAERSLAIYERLYGADHQTTAEALHALGYVKLAQFQFAEAEACFRRALAIRGRVFGVAHSDYRKSLMGLASVLEAQGRYAEAEASHRAAIVIEGLAAGPLSREAGRSLAGLARNTLLQGRVTQAEQLIKQSLAMLEKVVGADDPALAARIALMAEIAEMRGDYVSALAIRQRVLALRESVVGEEDSALAAPLLDLVRVLLNLERRDDASALLARAERLVKADLVPRMPEAAVLLESTALVEAAHGRLTEAEVKTRAALAAKIGLVGDDHVMLVSVLNNLGYICALRLNFVEAESILAKARRILERVGGAQHPALAPILANLVYVYSALDRRFDAGEAKAQLDVIISATRGSDGTPPRWL
jgi:hypothetical protein